MTADEDTGGSPPCLACEMDPAYAGFLPPEELAAELGNLLRLAAATSDPVAGRWRAVLEPALAQLPTTAATAQPRTGGDLVEAARRLLPRIADDRLHAALKVLLQS